MEDYLIEEVANILSEWNPLGSRAEDISDLDGYRTEAIDIIFNIQMDKMLEKNRSKAANIVKQVLNEAFDLSLSESECLEPAKRIYSVIYDRH